MPKSKSKAKLLPDLKAYDLDSLIAWLPHQTDIAMCEVEVRLWLQELLKSDIDLYSVYPMIETHPFLTSAPRVKEVSILLPASIYKDHRGERSLMMFGRDIVYLSLEVGQDYAASLNLGRQSRKVT